MDLWAIFVVIFVDDSCIVIENFLYIGECEFFGVIVNVLLIVVSWHESERWYVGRRESIVVVWPKSV